MLDRESDEHERGSDKERRIERKCHRTYGLREQSPVSEIVNGRHRRQYVGAAMLQPSESTGDQANQLHQTEAGRPPCCTVPRRPRRK